METRSVMLPVSVRLLMGMAFMFFAGSVFLFVSSPRAFAADKFWVGYNNVNSIQWEDTTNWSTSRNGAGGAGVPSGSDIAIFDKGGRSVEIKSVVKVDGIALANVWTGSVLVSTGQLLVGDGGIRMQSGRLLATGNGYIGCSGSYVQSGGIVRIRVLALSGSFTMTRGGGSPSNLLFTSTGTVRLDGTTDQTFKVQDQISLAGSGDINLKNLTLDNKGGGTSDDIVVNASGGLMISGALTITTGDLDLNTSNVVMRAEGGITVGNSAQATLTTDQNVSSSGTMVVNASSVLAVTGGTWIFNDDGNAEVNLDDQALYNVTLSMIPVITGEDNLVVQANRFSASGTLTLTRGELDMGGRQLTVTGSITVANDGTAAITATGQVFLGGSITHGINGGVMLTGAVITFNGTADQTIELLSVGSRFGTFTINNRGGGTSDDIVWSGATLTVSGALTISLGDLDLADQNVALRMDGGLTIANAAQATLKTDQNVTASGVVVIGSAGGITMTGGTWTFNDDGNTEVDMGVRAPFNVTINMVPVITGEDNLIVRANSFSASGTLTITRGEIDMGGRQLVVSGSLSVANDGTAALTATGRVFLGGSITHGIQGGIMLTGSTLTLNGRAADQTIEFLSVGSRFAALTIDNRGGGTSDDVIWSGSTLTVSGTLTITRGNLDLADMNVLLRMDGGMTMADAAQATFKTDQNVSASGSISVGDGAGITMTGGTWTFNDNGPQSVDLDDQSLFNVTMNLSDSGDNGQIDVEPGSRFSVSGALTVTLGELRMHGKLLTASGDVIIANNGNSRIIATGSVTFGSGIDLGAAGGFMLTGAQLTLSGVDQQLQQSRTITEDETVPTNGTYLTGLTVTASSGVTLVSHIQMFGTLTIETGSVLALGANTLGNTGGTIFNYASLREDTGKVVKTGSLLNVADSNYANVAEVKTGQTAYFTFREDDENISGTAKDTLAVTVTTAAGDSEALTLTETTNTSRIFRSSLPLAKATVAKNDGTIQTTADTTISISYTDAQDGLTNLDTVNFTVVGTASAAGGGGGGRGSGGGGGGGGGGSSPVNLIDKLVDAQQKAKEEDRRQERLEGRIEEGDLGMHGFVETKVDGKTVTFKDVPVKEWFAEFVLRVIDAGVASGYKDARGRLTGVFGPANNVTYAEIAKMALEAAGKDADAVTGKPKNRVARGQWSEKYVKLAEDLKLSAYDSSLDVNKPATRGAVVQTIMEAAGFDVGDTPGDYKDLRGSHPNANAIGSATELGIVSGDTNRQGEPIGRFRPNDPVNRAEVSKIMSKVLKLLGR